MEGNEYLGYRLSITEKFKVLHDTMRPAQKIGTRCTSEFCKKSELCAGDTLTEDERNSLFLNYWKNMTYNTLFHMFSYVQKSRSN